MGRRKLRKRRRGRSRKGSRVDGDAQQPGYVHVQVCFWCLSEAGFVSFNVEKIKKPIFL